MKYSDLVKICSLLVAMIHLAAADTRPNVILIMTDNGTVKGAKFEGLTSTARQGYNAGMRGEKSSIYEGGHRVPFLIHWPKGKITGGRDVSAISAHIDVLPTLAELCDVALPKNHRPDGFSFARLLTDPKAKPHRNHHLIQFQGGPYFHKTPNKWEFSCVLKERWRLIDGKELYDLAKSSSVNFRRKPTRSSSQRMRG